MIITRYITREVFQALLTVTIVLLLAFLCQQMVRYLNYAAVGKIPTSILLELVGFEIPYLLALLLPLGLYFGILLAYGRLQAENEMIVMRMAGLSKRRLLRITFLSASVVSLIILALMVWVNPMVSAKRQEVMSGHGATLKMIETLIPGRFQVSPAGNSVIYVAKMSRDRQRAKNVFLAKEMPKTTDETHQDWMLVLAAQGYQEVNKELNEQFFVLKDGYRYEGQPGQNDYKIIQFSKYAIFLPEKNSRIIHQEDETLSMTKLLQDYQNPRKAAELQWRISIPISAFILAMIAALISGIKPRQSRYFMLLPASILYIIYVNLLFSARHWLEQGDLPIYIGMWWVHVVFAVLFFILYISRSRA